MYIKRDLEEQIRRYMNAKEIIAVVGPRQSGKTTMIMHILDEIKDKNINRISFDNQKLLNLFEQDPDAFAELEVVQYDIVFIDEIQYSQNSGKILKYLHDTYKKKFVICGSSTTEMAVRSLRYLVGRVFIFTLFPFSFVEYLRAKEPRLERLYKKGGFKDIIMEKINDYLEDYIIFGGYPRVVTSNDRNEKELVLNNIYSTFMLRDVKPSLNIKEEAWTKLVKALSLQIGNLINYNELCLTTGLNQKNVREYIDLLEATYICRRVVPYFKNKRTELVKSKKIYFYDNGLRNAVINNFSTERADRGALLENFVFDELVKNNINPMYWRSKSGAEIDFVIENNTLMGIEVKNMSKGNITKSMLSFIKKYSPNRIYILSKNMEMKRSIGNTNVEFLPFARMYKIWKK